MDYGETDTARAAITVALLVIDGGQDHELRAILSTVEPEKMVGGLLGVIYGIARAHEPGDLADMLRRCRDSIPLV